MSSPEYRQHLPPELAQSTGRLFPLYLRSLAGMMVLEDPTETMRHIASHKTLAVEKATQEAGEQPVVPLYLPVQPINGTLGLELLDSQTRRGVAVCGYNIVSHEGEPVISVTHTPQGKMPSHGFYSEDNFTWQERRRLMNSTFREDMIEVLVAVAKATHISRISIISALNSQKFRSGEISWEYATKRMDDVALSCGFRLGHDNNYWRTL